MSHAFTTAEVRPLLTTAPTHQLRGPAAPNRALMRRLGLQIFTTSSGLMLAPASLVMFVNGCSMYACVHEGPTPMISSMPVFMKFQKWSVGLYYLQSYLISDLSSIEEGRA
jgi:hypothetical protein